MEINEFMISPELKRNNFKRKIDIRRGKRISRVRMNSQDSIVITTRTIGNLMLNDVTFRDNAITFVTNIPILDQYPFTFNTYTI